MGPIRANLRPFRLEKSARKPAFPAPMQTGAPKGEGTNWNDDDQNPTLDWSTTQESEQE